MTDPSSDNKPMRRNQWWTWELRVDVNRLDLTQAVDEEIDRRLKQFVADGGTLVWFDDAPGYKRVFQGDGECPIPSLQVLPPARLKAIG